MGMLSKIKNLFFCKEEVHTPRKPRVCEFEQSPEYREMVFQAAINWQNHANRMADIGIEMLSKCETAEQREKLLEYLKKSIGENPYCGR